MVKRLLFILLMLNTSVLADDKLAVVTETWWPFNYKDDNGIVVGSSTKWVRKLLEKSNVQYDLSLYTWHRSYQLANTEKNVLIYSIFRSPAREDLFKWICPLPHKLTHKIYKLRDRKDIAISSVHDLKSYSINVVRGTYPQNYLVDMGLEKNVNLHLASSNDANVSMLLKGRVDLIAEVEEALYQFVNDAGFDNDYVEEVYVFKNQPDLCMAFSKSTPDSLVDKVRASQQLMLDELAQNEKI